MYPVGGLKRVAADRNLIEDFSLSTIIGGMKLNKNVWNVSLSYVQQFSLFIVYKNFLYGEFPPSQLQSFLAAWMETIDFGHELLTFVI